MVAKSLVFCFVVTILSVFSQEPSSGCICVPFFQCKDGNIITDGAGIIDARYFRIKESGSDCPDILEICCRKRMVIQARRTLPPKRRSCGYRNFDGVGFRISDGTDNEAQFGEFPWMIAVMCKKSNEKKYLFRCGGSLIHPQVVLTAAHCVNGVNVQYKVRAGEWNSQTLNEMYEHQDRDVSSVVIHPQYITYNYYNDIALLFLSEPFKLTAHIGVICLPPQGVIADGSDCIATGWGKTNFEQGSQNQAILKKVELPIMPRSQCQKAFRKTRLGKYFELDRSFICAGGEEGVDSCIGDGGGPLVCRIEGQADRYQQIGNVAWGIECGMRGIPGAYVNVPLFRNWIDKQLKNKNLNTSVYVY